MSAGRQPAADFHNPWVGLGCLESLRTPRGWERRPGNQRARRRPGRQQPRGKENGAELSVSGGTGAPTKPAVLRGARWA